MAKKKPIEPIIPETIDHQALDELMGDRFDIYAKDVIQDRAIPDARDGLKPVQRRIIFAMYKTGNTIDKPTKKCAHIVGEVMGKYHPHGDSSIYEALVRMSQKWRVRLPLIDFQGNNGSMDGDGPAAYRYTEARLAAVSQELVADLDKNSVDMALTFDDTDFEPTVLPAHFPNLFVNGAEGIAVGLATRIPPHNLREVTNAVVYRINHPKCEIEELLKFVPAPDFPTGGIIYKSEGLTDIYTKGYGKIDVVGKTKIVEEDGLKQIIINEIPYGVIKSELVGAIDQIRHDKTIAGIDEVRDESDKSGLRIAVDLKDDSKPEAILAYLMQKTSLKSSYSANMVAIVKGRPKTLNLLDYCDTFIAHEEQVTTRWAKFDYNKNKARLSIVDGLIKANSIINEVIDTIRHSADKADSKTNLEKKFGFRPDQSEAIVMMPLYKLSHTDLESLLSEKKALEDQIAELKSIIENKDKLHSIIIDELKRIAKQYGDARRSEIQEDSLDLRHIDKRDLVAKENVMVAISRDGYVKRSSIASFKGSGGQNGATPGLKSGDTLIYSGECLTTDFMLIFTSKGNFLFIPVHNLKNLKWLEEGLHVNVAISLDPDDKLVRAFAVREFRDDLFIAILTRRCQVKRVRLSDFKVTRFNRPVMAMKLLTGDEVTDVVQTSGNSDLFIVSADGLGVRYNENCMEPSTTKSSGFKAAKFSGVEAACMLSFMPNEGGKVLLLTNYAHMRVFEMSHIETTERLAKPTVIFRSFKSEPHDLLFMTKAGNRVAPITYKTTLKNGDYFDATWADLYLTPMDRYAKKTETKITKKNCLVRVHRADADLIDLDVVALPAPPKKEKPAPEITPVPENTEPKETSDEPVEKFEQISIFGDDPNDDKK